MNEIYKFLDGISSYEVLNTITDCINKESFPIALIFEGVIDFESFSFQIHDKLDHNLNLIKIQNDCVLLIIYSNINNVIMNINTMVKIYNYKVYSIFLKKNFSDLVFIKNDHLNRNIYYLYYEDNNLTTYSPKNVKDIKIVSTSNSKIFYYGFNNLTDLIDFYILLITINKKWPIFVIYPSKNNDNQFNIYDEQKIIDDNKTKSEKLKLFYPTFIPYKFLYYISFFERNPPKSSSMTKNVKFYSIKNVQDSQISHLFCSKSNNLTIRTFLGFKTIFRCLHVLDFLSKNKKDFLFDFQLHFDLKHPNLTINSDLFYIEIQSLFDSTILYSINYIDSINLCNSSFLSFDNFTDFYFAKKMFSSIINCEMLFRDIIMLDNQDYLKLFPKIKCKIEIYYIAFRIKNKAIQNSMNISSLFKKSICVIKDAICSINNKSYIIIGFKDEANRNEAFRFMNENMYPLKSYYPEGMLKNEKIKEPSLLPNKMPLFQPKENLHYIYFQEYEKSKIGYSSNKVRHLFGIKNISDIQRNYYLQNDQREYTFIGFADKEYQQQILNNALAKKNVLFTNALNGRIFTYINNQNLQIVINQSNDKNKKNFNDNKDQPNYTNQQNTDKQNDIQQQQVTQPNDNQQQQYDNQANHNNQNLYDYVQSNNNQQNDNKQQQNKNDLQNKQPQDNKKNDIRHKNYDKQKKDNISEIEQNKTLELQKSDKNEYNISLNRELNNYIKKYHIGEGSYGNVYLVEEINSKKIYAAKVNSSKNKTDFIQEIHFYTLFQSPIILKLIDYGYSKLEKQSKLTLILEYMQNGSLENFLEMLRTKEKFNKTYKSKRYAILIGIAHGMRYLHGYKVIHRDLKPGNILLDENFCPKISDFGTAIIYLEETKFKKIQEKTIAGSYLYMAPEIFQEEEPYSLKVDVYSFSMIAYEIITGKQPFHEHKHRNRLKFIQDVKKNVRPDISMIEDQNIRIFLQRCWSNDPYERPDFGEIIKILNSHAFISYFSDEPDDVLNATSDIFLNYKMNKNAYSNIDYLFGKAILTMNSNCSQSEKQEALKILEKAASEGKKEAFLFMASYYLYKKEVPDNEKAAFYYKKAADSGIKEAVVKYGTCLFYGIGVKQDIQEAVFYYKKAADFGDVEALYNLGTIHIQGIGVKQNKKEAAKYLKLSADLGNVNAMYQYATMANDGNGIDIDYKEAEKYYKMAILKGDVESMFYYGIMLKDGSIPIDYFESTKYLKIAADKGHQSAMLHCADNSCIIAIFIEKDEQSKEKYLKTASVYYKKAADLGNYEASVSYSALFLRKMLDTNDMEMKVSYLVDAALNGNIDGIILYGFLLIENIVEGSNNINPYIDPYKFFVILGKNSFSMNKFKQIIDEIDKFSIRCKKNNNIFQLVPSIILTYQEPNNINRNIKESKTNGIKKCLKQLTEVKINVFKNYKLEPFDLLYKLAALYPFAIKGDFLNPLKSPDIPAVFPFYFSNFSMKKNILKDIDINLKKLPYFIGVKNNYCFPKDINDIFTFYEFNDVKSNFIVHRVVSQIMNEHKIESIMQIFKECIPYDEFLFFDESIFPSVHLQQFIKYLEINQNIIEIKRNIFDGFRIATYLNIKENTQNTVIQYIRDYLHRKDIVFSTFKYPLQNNIIINERMILQDANDFDVILNEIESIQIKPINIERNKLYIYDENAFHKLFQVFSFICFKNETDKMKALNHINSIVYKNKKNILQYNKELHYATINEYTMPEKVRKVMVKIFESLKGVEDIQRCVCSIESPIERTYIGFDSIKHLKKCYYKFVYQMNNVRTLNEKFFWKKKNLKYLMIFNEPNLSKYKCIQQILAFTKDVQENCCVPESIEGEKKTVILNASFFGFETKEDCDKAELILKNDPIASKQLQIIKYKEGKSYVNVSIDSREQYLFYNSL